MKKLVPDPPLSPTCTRSFGDCSATHPPLFSVNAGVDESSQQSIASEAATSTFPWLTMHAVEAAKGLVDAVIEGQESVGWTYPSE